MSRRARGEGSVFERNKGTDRARWTGSIQVDGSGGGRQRRWFYGASQAEVVRKVKAAQSLQSQGLPIPPERLTVAQLCAQWLADQRPRWADATYRRNEIAVREHIVPAIGKVRVRALTPSQVEAMLRNMGQSPRSQQIVRTTLRAAVARAQRWGIVGINVVTLTDTVTVTPPEVPAVTGKQAAAILAALSATRFANLYTLAVATGLRSGELLGLRWAEVDVEARTLRVTASLARENGKYVLKSPKTKRSIRTISPLPLAAVAALRAERLRQLEMRVAAGAEWGNEFDLVFTTAVGRPLNSSYLVHAFQAALATAGLPRMRLHDLRHATATVLLSRGTPLKVVQEQLGHSSVATTGNIYAHVVQELRADAANAMDQALG